MKKILAVDDNEDILLTIKTILELEGFDVDTVNSGEGCYDLLHKYTYNLILLDIMMPGLDGMDTVIKIKEDTDIPETPIIFLTAKTDKLSKGMGSICSDDYIEKPFEAKDLISRIKRVLFENVKNN